MDVWNKYKGKRVFLRTIHNRVYQGIVLNVEYKDNNLIWLTLNDIKGSLVTLLTEEITEIKGEDVR